MLISQCCWYSGSVWSGNRESGANPELPRSGKQERTPHGTHWFEKNWEAEVSRDPRLGKGL